MRTEEITTNKIKQKTNIGENELACLCEVSLIFSIEAISSVERIRLRPDLRDSTTASKREKFVFLRDSFRGCSYEESTNFAIEYCLKQDLQNFVDFQDLKKIPTKKNGEVL